MKKLLAILMCIIFALSLAACGQSPETKSPTPAPSGTAASNTGTDWSKIKPIKIKFAHGYAGTELAVKLPEEWMKLVTQKTNGAVTFEYYPGGSLGSLTELLQQTDLGALDMTLTDTSQLENLTKEYAILYYPFLFKSYKHQLAVLNSSEVMGWFNKRMAASSNIHILGYYTNGVRNIASKKKITNLNDAKNIIMRVPEIQSYKDTAKLLGMSPTTIPYSEMYTALSTGVVEAVECPNNSLYPIGLHKVGKYILKSGHMYASAALEFNKDYWNKLPVEVRQVMQDTFNSLTAAHADKVIAADDEYYKGYVKDGATVSEWDNPEEVAAIATDYWKERAGKLGPEAVDIVNRIIELRKKN